MNTESKMGTDFLWELKHLVRLKIGFPITTIPDCIKLSEAILAAGHNYVSETTLYRIFVKDKLVHQPYKHTLDILSCYVGFKSWNDFAEQSKGKNAQIFKYCGIEATAQKINRSLIYHCVAQRTYGPIQSYLESIEDLEEKIRFRIVLEIYDSLIAIEDTIDFFKAFANNKFVRENFFENGFDPNFKIVNYDKGFEFYAADLNIDKTDQDVRDFIFANAVLFRYSFIKDNISQCRLLGDKLYQNAERLEFELPNIHLFPRMRYLAYKLWYLILLDKTPNEVENYVLFLLDYCSGLYCKTDLIERKIMYSVVAEAFIYGAVKEKYHTALKEIFRAEFNNIPPSMIKRSLAHTLPYFEVNGMLYYRP